MPNISDEFRDALKEAVAEVFTDHSDFMSHQATHEEHHKWISLQIERERTREEFRRGLLAKSLPGIVWSLLAAGATTFYHAFKDHWK